MAEKTKQHFVPQFYLKNFAQGKFFNIYNSSSHKTFLNVPYKDQCYKKNFYGKDKKYEDELNKLEYKWVLAINNIINNASCISKSDEKTIKQFCCFQYMRTEKALLHIRNSMYESYKKIIPILCQFNGVKLSKQQINEYAYKYSRTYENIEDSTKKLINLAKKFYKKLDNLSLIVIENRTNCEFVTSDNPIIIGNEFQPEYGIGVDTIGIYFLFPISPYIYILLFDEKIYTKINEKYILTSTQIEVENLNKLQYYNSLENVFSATQSGVTYIKDYVDERIITIRKNVKEKYKNNYNNFFSTKEKEKLNTIYNDMVDLIDDSYLSIYSKIEEEKIRFDFLEIAESAKPFQNNINCNFMRSATKKDVINRINVLQPLPDDIQDSNSNKKIKAFYKEWSNFLIQYFKIDKI